MLSSVHITRLLLMCHHQCPRTVHFLHIYAPGFKADLPGLSQCTNAGSPIESSEQCWAAAGSRTFTTIADNKKVRPYVGEVGDWSDMPSGCVFDANEQEVSDLFSGLEGSLVWKLRLSDLRFTSANARLRPFVVIVHRFVTWQHDLWTRWTRDRTAPQQNPKCASAVTSAF